MSETGKEADWTRWDGGDEPLPVEPSVMIDAVLRDGFLFDNAEAGSFCPEPYSHPHLCTAQNCNWRHGGGDLDIVAYRHTPAPNTEGQHQ